MADRFFDHIFAPGFVTSSNFKSPLQVIKDPAPPRDRFQHGSSLVNQLSILQQQIATLEAKRHEFGIAPKAGTAIAIEIKPKGILDYKTFEWKREGIEVLSVTEGEKSDLVVIHVPEGRLSALQKRVLEYLNSELDIKNSKKPNEPPRPKNSSLINVIENIRQAAFIEFWTDNSALPAPDEPTLLQVWLRQSEENPASTRERFVAVCHQFQIEVSEGFITFPGRVVVAVIATRAAIESAVELLDMIAEIKRVSPTAEFFLRNLTPREQNEWIENLLARTIYSVTEETPRVTLFDTGVNYGHPLLRPVINSNDAKAYDTSWLGTDHEGHGTEMAGVAVYGDLTSHLASSGSIEISHRLESIKIQPPQGNVPKALWGYVVERCTNIAEEGAESTPRVFAIMTTADASTNGSPSDWSAMIDQLAFGREAVNVRAVASEKKKRQQRLYVLAAGNVPWDRWLNYPQVNLVSSVQDPGQSWNAITVGAATHLVNVDAASYPSYVPIAPLGGISPASTTSRLWSRTWPFKPDVVAEGGNGSIVFGATVSVGPESLRLITTGKDFIRSPFSETGDTSGAAAHVARLCALLKVRYPNYWPETIRALVIHGAMYTPGMLSNLSSNPSKEEKKQLLQTCGYGIINEERSTASTTRRPTYVVQQEITPYRRDGSSIKLGNLDLHELPWPSNELAALGEAMVKMKITLSYFVEPNPSSRGWQSKFRYQSFALRFAVKGASEDEKRFLQRINKLTRDTDLQESFSDPDSGDWVLGAQLRARGSIHSDIWEGTAAKLAAKSQIAVFPVGGWWKDWVDAHQAECEARYSLVVSLEVAEGVDIDLFTPIANAVKVAIRNVIDVEVR